ncbi:hypothetical protein ACHAPU_001299 [Fusarium lateritium]
MVSLNLTRQPYPVGNTEEEIRKDPTLCRICWNLYGGSASTAVPLAGISMHEHSGFSNAARVAEAGNLEAASAWAGRGRIDYASWEISIYLPDIPGSVLGGCASCLLLQEVLTKVTQGALKFNDAELWLEAVFCKRNVLRVKLIRGSPPDDFDMFSSGGGSTDGELLESYEIYTLPESLCPWPTIGSSMNFERPDWSLPTVIGGLAGHIEPDPTTKSSFDKIKSWLKICKSKHAVCSAAEVSTKSQLPKRVVDIGPGTNDGIHIFTHDDSAERITEPYIALSHCWGKTQHLISTKGTLDQWKQNIPFGRFAKTFQDAIIISRELGIRYLWIDSLCIVQDDKQDWEIEAAKMASIYNGAELVLSATGSSDGSGGCLFQREPFVTVSGTSPEGKPFEVYGRKMAKHSAFGWNIDPRESSKGSSNPIIGTTISDAQEHPLMTRAWCFQERLLATRILHYTKSEMIFDCLSSMECECGALERHENDPLVPARRIIKTGHKFITGTKSFRGTSTNPSVPLKGEIKEFIEHHELWRDLIVQYSQKNITKRSDGLPAIAGLATEWSNRLTGRYLAGLWERDLLNGLRWMPDEKDTGEEPQYIAPSWSWLSVHRGVTWGLESFEYDKYFVEVDFARTECPLSGHNKFGEVKSGYICLTGHVMPLTVSVNGDSVYLEKPGHAKRKPFERPDSLFRLKQLKTNDVWCLRLSTRLSTRNAWDDDAALVLVKAGEEALKRQPEEVRKFENVFQRVGYITNYMTDAWNHKNDSKQMEMYII